MHDCDVKTPIVRFCACNNMKCWCMCSDPWVFMFGWSTLHKSFMIKFNTPPATIQNNSSSSQADSKRAYQGIKFLVGLANKWVPLWHILQFLNLVQWYRSHWSGSDLLFILIRVNYVVRCHSWCHRCKPARDFLLSHAAEWQWAVAWLRKKVSYIAVQYSVCRVQRLPSLPQHSFHQTLTTSGRSPVSPTRHRSPSRSKEQSVLR